MSTTLTYLRARPGTAVLPPFLAPDSIEAAEDVTRHVTMSAAAAQSFDDRAFDRHDALPACEGPAEGSRASDDLIELFFFAYRDFVSDPDRILAQYGFGRAHHRVLHFVDRYPGLTIAELLDILKITKQSLNRVLKDLIEQGYVEQKTGVNDRRQRLLFCTRAGRDLAADLSRVQTKRVVQALAGQAEAEGADARTSAQDFLLGMIEPDERAAVRRLMARRAGEAA